MTLKYNILDNLKQMDQSVLEEFNKHSNSQHNQILLCERVKFKRMMEVFNCSEQCEFMIVDNNKLSVHNNIIHINTMFEQQFDKIDLVNFKFYDFIYDFRGNTICSTTELLQLDQMAFEYN